MQHKKVKFSALVLVCIGLIKLQAQETIPAAGGNASGSEGTMSYSIGQVVNTTNTGTNGSVAQGVQQPYEIFVINGIEEVTGIELICLAYPNPTTDFLILIIENNGNFNFSTLTFSLYEINGKLLESKKIESNETIIPMEDFIPSTYFLKVADHNNEVKIFRIIKN